MGLQCDRLGFTVEGLGLGLHLTSACTVPRRIGTRQVEFKIRISASHDRLGQASSEVLKLFRLRFLGCLLYTSPSPRD